MDVKSTRELIQYIEASSFTDVIFDCDETLMHFIIDWSWYGQELQKFAQKIGVMEQYNTMKWNPFLEHVLLFHGVQHRDEINKFTEIAEEKDYKETIPNMLLIEWVQKNVEKYRFHLISNNMTPVIKKGLTQYDLKECFHTVIGRDNVTYAKPNSEGIEHVCNTVWAKKEHVLMVGDNPTSDGEAARRAGVEYFCIDMYL